MKSIVLAGSLSLLLGCSRPLTPAERVAQADALLHAEHTCSPHNARQAQRLLLAGRPLSALTPEELSLVCTARNELAELGGELEAAQQLWNKTPGTRDAVRWMTNALHNVCMKPGLTQNIISFTDQCLAKGYGNRTEMLVLKAEATITGKHGPDPKAAATALLFEAYTIPDASAAEVLPLDFVFRGPFSTLGSVFTPEERRQLQERVQEHWRILRTFGRYLPYRNTPIPEDVSRLVAAFCEAYASLDIDRVASTFLPASADEQGKERSLSLAVTRARFEGAKEYGREGFPCQFSAMCFDPEHATVLLEETGTRGKEPIEGRQYELDLVKTNKEWKVSSFKQLFPGDLRPTTAYSVRGDPRR